MASSRSELKFPAASVLLIDDNTMGLGARQTVLEEMGLRITAAATPGEAMQAAASQSFDLVITDYRMPEMNGAELIAWMRGQGMKCPVILISGFVETMGLTAENTGANVVIQKSSHEVPHLMRAVRDLLTPRRPMGSQGGRGRPRRTGLS